MFCRLFFSFQKHRISEITGFQLHMRINTKIKSQHISTKETINCYFLLASYLSTYYVAENRNRQYSADQHERVKKIRNNSSVTKRNKVLNYHIPKVIKIY